MRSLTPQTNNKYGAWKTEYNGHTYDSRKEAKYAEELDLRVKAGEIKSWDRQVRLDCVFNYKKCFFMKIDFLIHENDGSLRYVDVKGYKKGMAYTYWNVKRKVIQALMGIDIETA